MKTVSHLVFGLAFLALCGCKVYSDPQHPALKAPVGESDFPRVFQGTFKVESMAAKNFVGVNVPTTFIETMNFNGENPGSAQFTYTKDKKPITFGYAIVQDFLVLTEPGEKPVPIKIRDANENNIVIIYPLENESEIEVLLKRIQ